MSQGARVIGVNNRNLHTFTVDLKAASRVAAALDQHQTKISSSLKIDARGNFFLLALSGISSGADVTRYVGTSVGGVLVGEALMRSNDPAALIAELQVCLHMTGPHRSSRASSLSSSFFASIHRHNTSQWPLNNNNNNNLMNTKEIRERKRKREGWGGGRKRRREKGK